MSSSRDSSVWRSLAVAFGDGLAFGVGMKLTQTAGAKAPSADAALPAPLTDRLALLEERLRKIERMPLPPADPATALAPAKIDHQVLDAVVNAVETRLQEQAAAVERRLADIEARLAVELKSVHEELHALAAGADVRIRETQAAFQESVLGTRRELAEVAAGRRNDASAIAAGLEKLGHRIVALERNATAGAGSNEHIAAMAAKVDQIGHNLLAGYETLRTQVADFDRKNAVIEAGFNTAIAAEAARLREELARAERAVATMQSGVEQAVENALGVEVEAAERRLLDQVTEASSAAAAMIARDTEAAIDRRFAPLGEMLETIGQSYLSAAQRATAPAAEEPELPAAKPAASETESAETPPADSPLFADGRKPGRVWRIPLVSSFLIGATGLALLQLL